MTLPQPRPSLRLHLEGTTGKVAATGELLQPQLISGDDPLRRHLDALHIGDSVLLDVGGFVGRWRRLADGLMPLDPNVSQAWSSLRAAPARAVDIQLVTTDGSHLVTFGVRGQLWDDPASQYR